MGAPIIKEIPLADITVRTSLRAVQPKKVDELANSMQAHGLFHPILVCPSTDTGYELIAGAHRLEAAKRIDWTSIQATVLEGIDADKAKLIQIDENLVRVELTPAQRAKHLAERKAIYVRLHPETKHGGDRSRSRLENLKSFVADIAGKIGRGRSSVARDVARGIKISVLPDIVGTSLDKGEELDALAKLPEAKQRELAELAQAGLPVSAKPLVEPVGAEQPAATSPRTRRPAMQMQRDQAENGASHVCGAISVALDADYPDMPNALVTCLLSKHLDELVEFARHPRFVAVADAVMAKLKLEPAPNRESEIRLIGLQSEKEESWACLTEPEAAPAPIIAASTDSATSDADLDVRMFAGGALRR